MPSKRGHEVWRGNQPLGERSSRRKTSPRRVRRRPRRYRRPVQETHDTKDAGKDAYEYASG
jgi:hypothetical protein